MNATTTLTCSHCGEMRTDGQFHDAQRCWTIAHALVTMNQGWDIPVNDATEADRHIVELTRWLADHPYASTPQARQAKTDREVSLDRWIAKAQMMRSGHTAAAPQD